MIIKNCILSIYIVLLALTGCALPAADYPSTDELSSETGIQLPTPLPDSDMSIEEALWTRRSVREYSEEPVPLEKVAQLLWAAQGVTSDRGYRTAPSAGALYPLELYLAAGEVENLEAGVYRYEPEGHALIPVSSGDVRSELQAAGLEQSSIGDAPAVIVIAAVYERTSGKYGERGTRYVHMETGCAAQNIYLQAVSLDLGTVFIGAFYDQDVQRILSMQKDHQPLAIMPLGNK